ncbi:MAG: hypothetical protein M3417_13265 [Actinomycetota bacterium]|nr:hypothetical protein [Actinomycetota bacterium]
MSDTQTSNSLDKVLESRWAEAQRLETAVYESLDAAAREVEQIRGELERAFADKSYVRVDEVHGVDAQAVFSAFGAVERIAELELARGEEKATWAKQRLALAQARLREDPQDEYLQAEVDRYELDSLIANAEVEEFQQRPALQQASAAERAAREGRLEQWREQQARDEERVARHRLDDAEVALHEDPEDRSAHDEVASARDAWLRAKATRERLEPGAEGPPGPNGVAPGTETIEATASREERGLVRDELGLGEEPNDGHPQDEVDQAMRLRGWGGRGWPAPASDLPPDAVCPPPTVAERSSAEVREDEELRDRDFADRIRIRDAADRDAERMRERAHDRPAADIDPPAPEL